MRVEQGGFRKGQKKGLKYGFSVHLKQPSEKLVIKNNQLPSRLPVRKPERKFRVVKKCDVIVWPCKNLEVIRQAEEGEIILGRSSKQDKEDHIAVFQDGDDAYIKSDALVAIDLEDNSKK